jgi:hypothetical protein
MVRCVVRLLLCIPLCGGTTGCQLVSAIATGSDDSGDHEDDTGSSGDSSADESDESDDADDADDADEDDDGWVPCTRT